jgi:hypothetical protein
MSSYAFPGHVSAPGDSFFCSSLFNKKKRPVATWADQSVPPICCFKTTVWGEKRKKE